MLTQGMRLAAALLLCVGAAASGSPVLRLPGASDVRVDPWGRDSLRVRVAPKGQPVRDGARRRLARTRAKSHCREPPPSSGLHDKHYAAYSPTAAVFTVQSPPPLTLQCVWVIICPLGRRAVTIVLSLVVALTRPG